MVHKLYLDLIIWEKEKKKKNYVLETLVSKKTKKKRKQLDRLLGELSLVWNREEKEAQRSDQKEGGVYYIPENTTLGSIKSFH